MAFCDSNIEPTYGTLPILVIVVGVASAGRFFTDDGIAVPPFAAIQTLYDVDTDFNIKAYKTPD